MDVLALWLSANLQGSNFRFSMDQLMVFIGDNGMCRVLRVTLITVECIPIEADYPINRDIPLIVRTSMCVCT